MSYRSTHVNVELIASPATPKNSKYRSKPVRAKRGSIGIVDRESGSTSFSLATTEFTSAQQRESFNAIISLRELPHRTDPTVEHKVCGMIGFAVCILLLIILSYGKLTQWRHRVEVQSVNSSMIHNSSFVVTCSWHKLHFESSISTESEETYYFGELCSDKMEGNVLCSFCCRRYQIKKLKWSGIGFFISMLVSALILLTASVLLVDPSWCRCLALKHAKWLMAVSGLICFVSIIPVTITFNEKGSVCGYPHFGEGDENNNVENHEVPLWTMYLAPIIGVFLTLSACFVAQIASRIPIEI